MEPLITGINQIAFVVEDLMESVKLYNDVYGVGPWVLWEYDESNVENVIQDGKPITYGTKLASCRLPNIELELIQPMDDKSTFGKFLKEHGPGLHHICIDTSKSYGETLQIMEKNSAPTAMTALFRKVSNCAFTDATKKLGTFFELRNPLPNFYPPVPDGFYPPKEA